MYVDEEVKVKNYVQHLSQTLAMINDLSCVRDTRDLCPTDSLHSFESGDEVLLKTWKTGSPESQLEKWTGTCVKQTFISCLVGVGTPLER